MKNNNKLSTKEKEMKEIIMEHDNLCSRLLKSFFSMFDMTYEIFTFRQAAATC